jgi:hypothetical protein
MQTPTVGRVVLALVDRKSNNGSDVAPAVITRVWNEYEHNGESRWLVNYRITGDNTDVPVWKTSAQLFADEAAARAFLADGTANGMQAFWPPRV